MDLAPVLERFDGLTGRMDQFERQMLERLGPGEADEGDGEGEGDGFEFDLESLYGDPEDGQTQRALDPQALQQLIDSHTQQAIQAAMSPVMQQVQSIQLGLDAEALTAKYPDLAKPEIAQPVVNAARELAEAAGNPGLATNTQVLEVIYKAQMADKYAAGEVPVGAEKGFELERAGGAGPAAGDEPNIAERIAARRQEREFWKF